MPWLEEALEMKFPPVSAAPSAPLCAECSPSVSKKNGCLPQTLSWPSARAASNVSTTSVDGVIGYQLPPSTEVVETFEAARADGQLNVWGKHPFFFETEGEHSAQSGALGAALTGGNFISNASSGQGVLYALESHYVTAGKKIGGFVLQVAARVVSKHSLNVMAGH